MHVMLHGTVAQADQLPAAWRSATGQQPLRECDQASCSRKKGLLFSDTVNGDVAGANLYSWSKQPGLMVLSRMPTSRTCSRRFSMPRASRIPRRCCRGTRSTPCPPRRSSVDLEDAVDKSLTPDLLRSFSWSQRGERFRHDDVDLLLERLAHHRLKTRTHDRRARERRVRELRGDVPTLALRKLSED